MSERARGWLETLGPLLLALIAVAFGYGALSSRVATAEADASQIHDVRERLIRIETILEQRLPGMGG